MTEKIALADGRADAPALLAACRDAARRLVAFDMAALADATGSAISAVLFGALAGSGALPFPRTAFEAAIRRGDVGVNSSLAAFGAGFEAARRRRADHDRRARARPCRRCQRADLRQARRNFRARRVPSSRRRSSGCTTIRTPTTPRDFLARLEPFKDIEQRHGDGSGRLLEETARQLALAMAYEDTIRVADLKIRASRFARVREEAQIADGQISRSPSSFIRACRRSPIRFRRRRALAAAHALGPRPARPRHPQGQDRQDHLGGRLPPALRAVAPQAAAAPLAALRRGTGARADWLDLVAETARTDYALALQVARMRSLVKGYGDTHERGRAKFDRLAALLPRLRGRTIPARSSKA